MAFRDWVHVRPPPKVEIKQQFRYLGDETGNFRNSQAMGWMSSLAKPLEQSSKIKMPLGYGLEGFLVGFMVFGVGVSYSSPWAGACAKECPSFCTTPS